MWISRSVFLNCLFSSCRWYIDSMKNSTQRLKLILQTKMRFTSCRGHSNYAYWQQAIVCFQILLKISFRLFWIQVQRMGCFYLPLSVIQRNSSVPFNLESSCSFVCWSSTYLCLCSLTALLNSSPCLLWSPSRFECSFFSSSCWLYKKQNLTRFKEFLIWTTGYSFGFLGQHLPLGRRASFNAYLVQNQNAN